MKIPITNIELIRYIHRRIYSFFQPKRKIFTALPLNNAQGMDGARYQVTFDPDIATIPLSFAFQKLTQGTSYRDPSIDVLWQGVSKLPVRGGYHYMQSGMSWSAQASNYLGAAELHDYNVHAVDLEEYGNTYNDTFFADTRRVIDAIRSARRQKVLLYTNNSTYILFASAIKRLYSDGQSWLDELDFWVAYPSTTLPAPPVPSIRNTAKRPWTVWQDNWNCTQCGCQSASDHNFFNGSIMDLYEWAGVGDEPPIEPPPTTPPTEPPPTNGGTVTTYTVKAKADNTKIFKNYDGSGGDIDSNFDTNETAKGDSINYAGYMHLYQMNGVNINGYVHTSKINYTQDIPVEEEEEEPTDPPPAGTTLPATVESTDVWKDDNGVIIATYKGTLTKQ